MTIAVLKYSLKVWLTSVLVAPALITTAFSINTNSFIPLPIGIYVMLVFFQFIFSFFTWMLYLLSINVITGLELKHSSVKWLICLTGIALTAATVVIDLQLLFDLHDAGLTWLLIGCNCFCIGAGSWYYKLDMEAPDHIPEQTKDM